NATLQNQSLAPGANVADVNLGLSPNVQPTDMGTKQVSSQLSLAWQESARLSFNFSTGYFGMIRNAPGLVGATGNQAQGSANYRYSRRTTVGLFYSYGHNQYPHGFGASDSNSAGVTYSIALGRSLQIKLRGGLSKTESIAESEVPLPP